MVPIVFWLTKKKLGHQKFGSKKIFVLKIKGPKNIGFKRFVQIGPVINEIFLIWTNVAMKNVAWTNVIMTYEYERQEPAPRHGPGPLVPVFPALRAGRVPVRP